MESMFLEIGLDRPAWKKFATHADSVVTCDKESDILIGNTRLYTCVSVMERSCGYPETIDGWGDIPHEEFPINWMVYKCCGIYYAKLIKELGHHVM